MKILVTSGGTTEMIDSVRGITNQATGKLGSLVADAFGKDDMVDEIFYICSDGAQRPQTPKAKVLTVTDTFGLEVAVLDVLEGAQVDAVVHAMAVSDYKVRAVTTVEMIARSVASSGRAHSADSATHAIHMADRLDNTSKLTSEQHDLVLMLEPTTKVISLFGKYAPTALLVGFKLLDGVSHQALIDTGYTLMARYGATWVLANDTREIGADYHVGYLIGRDNSETRFGTKEEIAQGIAGQVLASLKEATKA
jgi:phosphopantothenate-cysteine ligase